VFDSPHVTTGAELADFARPSFAPGRPMLECVTEFTKRIHKEFTFDKAVTTIGTPVLEVLQHKHGVCQDFAHLQIACLRSLGLAARYVSGYLVTQPPPGQPRLVGTDASHAWVSVFFPDYGWIDFDPTNGILPSAEHITLGWARDYSDLSPVRGVVVGGSRHALRVSVDVEPIGAKEKKDGKVTV
jgi:transglutaminase-like putative cysteine protease